MEPAFVLVHSLALGPSSWAPVARALAESGRVAFVPSLVHIAGAEPPFWPHIAATVGDSIARSAPGTPVVLVAHSNAGLFVPAVVDVAARPVVACVFVDAALPARSGR
jgi:hypothetical protein